MKLVLIIVAVAALLAAAGMLVFVYVIQNVETPAYSVVTRDGPFELRDYPAMQVAEVSRSGERERALGAGFGTLARYIFAKERDGERIAMTAPVEQQSKDHGDGDWAIRFIMPSRYAVGTLPDPASRDVALRQVPPRRVATIRFSGRTTDAAIARRQEALMEWLQRRGLVPVGDAIYAYYNDPFTPGFLRRNEVLIDVATGAEAVIGKP